MQELIYELVEYGIQNGLIPEEDITYRVNVLAEFFDVSDFTMSFREYEAQRNGIPANLSPDEMNKPGGGTPAVIKRRTIGEILGEICDLAVKNGIIKEDTVTNRDLFDTKVMGLITPAPSVVRKKFDELYAESPEAATKWYYDFSISTNYIRKDRIVRDEKWATDTAYGPIDISINLAKPEKDPKAIAAAGAAKKSGYPACLLCKENEGYAGHLTHQARQNHRIIPVTLGGEQYYLQYSPYVYYNEHCIVFNEKHIPMVINRAVFTKLFDFIDCFPHYTVGSNADLPIVGGSILSHDHFQGGNYTFAMAKADYEETFELKKYPHIKAGIIKWPMSVIRLQGEDRTQIEEASYEILQKWRGYSDESAGIRSFSVSENDGPRILHNTITPIARMRGDLYEIDLVLRNNRTDKEHPWGIFHPTADLHHIKKENIGLIEVMGLAILPARLKTELAELEKRILDGSDLRGSELTAKHADWAEEWRGAYPDLSRENIHGVVQNEVGKVFAKVLECAGVYKRDEKGRAAFCRFIRSLDE